MWRAEAMFEHIILELEQTDLFERLVEAARAVPRQSFALRQTLGTTATYSRLVHPGLGAQDTQVYPGHLKALHDAGLITWDHLSRGLIEFDVTPLGFRYYDHLHEPIRYTTEQQFERVLHAIANYDQQYGTCTPDTFIAEDLDLPLVEVRAYMDELAAAGLTQEANAQESRCALLKGSGRIALNDPDFLTRRLQPAVQHISGNNFQGAIVNISSSLTSVTQTINAAGSLNQATKQELLTLVEQLQEELEKIRPDNADDADAVAEAAKRVVEDATRERPNKVLIKVSADGLRKATENLTTVAPPVVSLVVKLLGVIQGAG